MLKNNKSGVLSFGSAGDRSNLQEVIELFKNSPIPLDQIFENLGLFLNSKDLSRILFMNYIFKKVNNVQGVVFDFGTRWGHNMALFSALRGIYEPYNRHKKIIGFDTFSGFLSISKKDGISTLMKKGNISTTKRYQEYLEKIMQFHEKSNPLSHIKKYEVVVGDAIVQLRKYLRRNPQTIVALAYFDFDIYEPTKKCLQLIRPHLVKGSLLAFDELNDQDSPGETVALSEVFGLNNIRLKRYPFASRVSYFILE